MNWKRAVVGAGVAIPMVALLAYGLTQDPKAIASPLPGRAAPDFTLPTMDGKEQVSLAALRGKIVVLNFWASWCLECQHEHAPLSETATAYYDKGVRFFGMLYSDNAENGTRWIEMMGGQSYPTLIDPGSRAAIDYGLYGVPETFFIDGQGRVFEKKIGAVTTEYLKQTLDKMLAAHSTTAPTP